MHYSSKLSGEALNNSAHCWCENKKSTDSNKYSNNDCWIHFADELFLQFLNFIVRNFALHGTHSQWDPCYCFRAKWNQRSYQRTTKKQDWLKLTGARETFLPDWCHLSQMALQIINKPTYKIFKLLHWQCASFNAVSVTLHRAEKILQANNQQKEQINGADHRPESWLADFHASDWVITSNWFCIPGISR